MKTDWQIPDILDLEYFLYMRESEEEAERNADTHEDRDIYLNQIQPKIGDAADVSRRWLVKAWLNCRRAAEKERQPEDAALPGETYSEIYKLLQAVFLVLGCVTGGGVAASLLRYSGVKPVNVASYLGVLVLLQIGLLVLTAGLMALRTVHPTALRQSILYGLVSNLALNIGIKLKQKASRNLSSAKRESIAAAFGLFGGKRRVYGDLFIWPMFLLFQLFGIAFNVGALAATLFRVLGTDLAFGWQSTLQLSAASVYRLVHLIALPWTWFVPAEIAHPTLAQVKGSHMILKEGIYHMATVDLVAWWPFLCFAVAFYGLLPRVLLFTFGKLRMHHTLHRLDFGHSDIDRLIHRLSTPRVTTKGTPSAVNPESDRADLDDPTPTPDSPVGEGGFQSRRLVALIPDDVYDDCPDADLQRYVRASLAAEIVETFRVGEDVSSDRKVIEQLSRMDWPNGNPGVFMLQEAWQPPIKEFFTFLSELRRTVGERAKIEIGLIGRPAETTIFTPPSDDDWRTWRRKLRTIGDPYLRLERLVTHEP